MTVLVIREPFDYRFNYYNVVQIINLFADF